LTHRTQRADLILESVAALIEREADGRTFRLIGVGIAELGSAAAADPVDLFSFASPSDEDGVAESNA
jgi:DNA polymerase-4